jgi:hypothetical protein
VIKRKTPKVKRKVKELGRRKANRTITKRTKVTTRGKKRQGRKKRRKRS